MAFDKFPKKKAGDRLSVGFINRLSKTARLVEASGLSSFVNSHLGPPVSASSPLPQNIQVPVEITNNKINDEDAEDSGLFLCKIRYFKPNTSMSADVEDGEWELQEKEWRLDANGAGTSLLSMPSDEQPQGDRVNAYWHQQRGMFVPVIELGSGISLYAEATAVTDGNDTTADIFFDKHVSRYGQGLEKNDNGDIKNVSKYDIVGVVSWTVTAQRHFDPPTEPAPAVDSLLQVRLHISDDDALVGDPVVGSLTALSSTRREGADVVGEGDRAVNSISGSLLLRLRAGEHFTVRLTQVKEGNSNDQWITLAGGCHITFTETTGVLLNTPEDA